MRENSLEQILGRLLQVLSAKNESELARRLGTSSSNVSTWRKRGSVPLAICEQVARERGLSLDWLLYGEGAMHRGEAGQAAPIAAETPREQALLALWRELDEDAQREIQRAAEEKKRLNTLEQRVSELEAVVAAGKRLA
ncbi:helix-turn-helix domain-containing protein [Pseudomonas sp. BMW13]|uniref:helix-turn-helix domain-containing protein n=1 Tax=Pseudomonas sp. BMW13 TaxID=2562590 RepID=UPI001582406D|nr:helix-turn-helix domain-containing protein [Pseudomonas sp. BMW13]